MKTMTEPVVAMGPPIERHLARWMRSVALLMAVLAVGIMGGWWMARAVENDPTTVTAGSVKLTDRQVQMVDMTDAYVAAWQANDVDKLLSMFAPNGTLGALGTTYRVDDGTLASYVRSMDWSTLQTFEPKLVDGNRLALGHLFHSAHYMNTIQFTATGQLLIAQHVITG